ncbi:MAG TPA: glycosyltransferase family 4 protein [Thermoplasmata archaeon]|nr:glycosyltransferase family 4 protein [Thermoplasmata archaeon]
MASTLMLLANPYRPDPRVRIEAKALADAGHSVTVLAWSRDTGDAGSAKDGAVEIVRVGPLCPFRSAAKMIMRLPMYWLSALRTSGSMEFDIIHSHDLDTLPAGLMIGWLRDKPVLYDAHELYAAMVKDDVGPMFRPLQMLESCLVRRADAVVTVSDTLAHELSKGRTERPSVVMTSPDIAPLSDAEVKAVRERYGLTGFVVSYLGSLEPGRFVEDLLDAFTPEDGVTVLVAGKGSLEKKVRESTGRSQVKYVGAVSTDEALRLTAASDLVTAMMDPANPNNVVGTPGKILNSMALAKPYITTQGLDIAEMTGRVGSGIVVAYDRARFREAVLRSKQDPKGVAEMGRRGREHFASHMSWAKSRGELLEAYDRLLGA